MLDPREVRLIAGALRSVSAVLAIAKIDPSVEDLPGVSTLRISSGSHSVLLHHALVNNLLNEEDLIAAMVEQGMGLDHSRNYVSFLIETPPTSLFKDKDAVSGS